MALIVRSACRAQVEAVAGAWAVTGGDADWHPDCHKTWTLQPHGSIYNRTGCPSPDDDFVGITDVRSSTCWPDGTGAITGTFVEHDSTWNLLYCGYWSRGAADTELQWEWFWTNDMEAGCPAKLTEAKAKTPTADGDGWKVGGSTPTTLQCEGACPAFDCACMGTQCGTAVKLLAGEWAATDKDDDGCDMKVEYRNTTAKYTYENCDESDQDGMSNVEIKRSACYKDKRGGFYGHFIDYYAEWEETYCSYWHRESSTAELVVDWWGTNVAGVGCPLRLEQAQAKPEKGDEWFKGAEHRYRCDNCPEFECECTAREEEAKLPRCMKPMMISSSMAQMHKAKRCTGE